jgi:transposase-like protein
MIKGTTKINNNAIKRQTENTLPNCFFNVTNRDEMAAKIFPKSVIRFNSSKLSK